MGGALSGGEAGVLSLVHLQVGVEDLEHLLDVGHIAGLQLGPHRNV